MLPRKVALELVITQSDNACIVSVTDKCGRVIAEGTSRRMPDDPQNKSLGLKIAVKKALTNLQEKTDRWSNWYI